MNYPKKQLLFVLLTIFVAASNISAQPIRKVSLWGKKVVPLLLKFDSECVRESYKINGNMGIYKIVRYAVMRDSLEHWLVTLVLDDRYKEDPPTEYAQIGSDIFFFYDVTSSRTTQPKSSNQEVIAFLDELVADRLYIRPTQKQRWAEFREKGEIVREKVQKDISGGYPRNSIWFTFQKDGTVTPSRPFRE